MRLIQDGEGVPPVIVTCQDGQLVLEDGNHRVEGLRRSGAGWAWAIVGFTSRVARDRFESPEVD